MKIVAISDTHNRHKNLIIPKCDILAVVGDYTSKGYLHEVKDFCKWLNKQPAKYKIVVQGNHEIGVQNNFAESKLAALEACPDVIFVEHEVVEIEGLKIFCSAWTPWFHDWAYNASRHLVDAQKRQIPYIKDKWKDIPLDTDMILAHTPIHGIHDAVYYVDGITIKERVGCWHLGEKISELPKLKHFVSGHLHSNNMYTYFKGIHFYGVPICDEQYYPSQPITVFEI